VKYSEEFNNTAKMKAMRKVIGTPEMGDGGRGDGSRSRPYQLPVPETTSQKLRLSDAAMVFEDVFNYYNHQYHKEKNKSNETCIDKWIDLNESMSRAILEYAISRGDLPLLRAIMSRAKESHITACLRSLIEKLNMSDDDMIWLSLPTATSESYQAYLSEQSLSQSETAETNPVENSTTEVRQLFLLLIITLAVQLFFISYIFFSSTSMELFKGMTGK
jgi:hypothetical protein